MSGGKNARQRWTRPDDLHAQLLRLWEKGEPLAGLITGEAVFPRRLVLKTPSSTEVTGHFDDVRDWVAQLRALPRCRIETREFTHRVFGRNSLPDQIWIDSLDDAAALIGKQRDLARFAGLIEATHTQQPALLDWLAKRPLRALALADDWPRLLAIVAWLRAHPRPGLYLRQIDLPGIHSKFIENHRGVLAELLDIVLPPEAIDSTATGTGQFAARYGFRDKPQRIRFRLLDPRHTPFPGSGDPDITLDAATFARLAPAVRRVFITENEINFLAFPPVAGSLIIFGAGYGLDTLGQIPWLARCRIHYWGDIDTHGFAILDQLRSHLPHAASFLMDRTTLLANQSAWGEEDHPTRRDLPRLTPEESTLYDDLRHDRIRPRLRLEQERIGYAQLEALLAELPPDDAAHPGRAG